MWFKNLIIYRLENAFSANIEQLERQLSSDSFISCGRQKENSLGWVNPLGVPNGPLVHTVGRHMLLCARKEKKILPTFVVNDALQEHLKQLAQAQKKPISLTKAEKQRIKEKIYSELLPRAFSQFNNTKLWIDLSSSRIIVDCASESKAEEMLCLLRQSTGSLPIIPWMQQVPTVEKFTKWVSNDCLPKEFVLQEEAELRSIHAAGGIIHCKQQPLSSDEIAAHLAAAKTVTKLALCWQEKIQFLITEHGVLKRLKYAKGLRQKHDEIDQKDILQRMDADFILLTHELSSMLADLYKALHPSLL